VAQRYRLEDAAGRRVQDPLYDGVLLQGYEKSANAMSIMLRGMSPTDDAGLAELDKLRDMARGTE
jgi:hypothetical protein